MDDAEWKVIEVEYGFPLPDPVRDELSRALWWCGWHKRLARTARTGEALRRFAAFERAAIKCLDAFDYAAHYDGGRFDGAERLVDHPPSHPAQMFGAAGEGPDAWSQLRFAATSQESGHPGHWVARAVPDGEAVLFGLWALAHTSRRARATWDQDKGGARPSGDAAFVKAARYQLKQAGLPAGFTTDPDDSTLSGPFWNLVQAIWSRRPDNFVADKSTLARHVRASSSRSRDRTKKG